MNIKNLLLTIAFSLPGIFCFSQQYETVLSAPETWPSELFPFPLSFAPSLDYHGFEDIRFTPGWRDSTSNNVWTYTFVWVIDERLDLTPAKLSANVNAYFDGLMKVNFADENDPNKPEKTISEFEETDLGFRGEISVHDAFISNKTMKLFCEVSEIYCNLERKNIITFKFSQKEFGDEIWTLFDNVRLVNLKCH